MATKPRRIPWLDRYFSAMLFVVLVTARIAPMPWARYVLLAGLTGVTAVGWYLWTAGRPLAWRAVAALLGVGLLTCAWMAQRSDVWSDAMLGVAGAITAGTL